MSDKNDDSAELINFITSLSVKFRGVC